MPIVRDLVTYAMLPGELLRELRCKAIGRFGLGVDNIDTKTAAELGIVVTYVPDYCMHEARLRHGVSARARPQDSVLRQAGASGPLEMPAVAPLRRLAGQVLA